MTDSEHSGEVKEQWRKTPEETSSEAARDPSSPSAVIRAFAVVLLLLTMPLLLFFGGCGVVAATNGAAFFLTPTMLGICVGLAFASYKGVQTFWRGDWSGVGWALALIILALISVSLCIWVSTWWNKPLNWPN